MTVGLPVDLVVNVNVNQQPAGGVAANQNSLMVMGDSNVIDVSQRIRQYADAGAVALDFGSSAPEYAAAALFFAQTPKPTVLMCGRWASAAVAGLLHGGALTAVQQVISNFTGITTGALTVTIDGIPYSITGLNFSAAANMNVVAADIQTALQTATGGTPTCVWDSVYNRFNITSGTTGTGSGVSVASAPTAEGSFAFGANPIDGNSISINGTTVTFHPTVTGANVVALGGSLPVTLANLMAFLGGSTDTNLSKITYSLSGSTVYMLSNATGTVGDAYLISSSGAFAVASGSTLTGGSGVDVSTLLALTRAAGGIAVAGQAAETAVAGVSALDNVGTFWYALQAVTVASGTLLTADKLAIATYIEASKHVYGITSSDANCLDPQSAADIAYLIKNGRYNRSTVQYSSLTPYAVASFFGRMLTVDPNANNSTITLNGKSEPAVQAETITVGQAAALKAKNCNVFVNYSNGAAIIQYGTMGSGLFFDSVFNADMLANAIQTNCFNAIVTNPTKIPQTDAGNNQLAGVIEQTLDGFGSDGGNGYLGPGYWTLGGVGQVKTGDFLPKGYYVYTPPISSQSETDRLARKSVSFTVLAKEAGAIHSASILINVNR